MTQKRFHTRFNGYQMCKYGKTCACSPKPEDRRKIFHPKANLRQKRFDDKFYRDDQEQED